MLGDQYKRLTSQSRSFYDFFQKIRTDPTLGSKVEVDVKTMWLFFGDLLEYLKQIPDYDAKADAAVAKRLTAAQEYDAVLNRIESVFSALEKENLTEDTKLKQAALREMLIHFHLEAPLNASFTHPDDREQFYLSQIEQLNDRIKELQDWIKNPAKDGTPYKPNRNGSHRFLNKVP